MNRWNIRWAQSHYDVRQVELYDLLVQHTTWLIFIWDFQKGLWTSVWMIKFWSSTCWWFFYLFFKHFGLTDFLQHVQSTLGSHWQCWAILISYTGLIYIKKKLTMSIRASMKIVNGIYCSNFFLVPIRSLIEQRNINSVQCH